MGHSKLYHEFLEIHMDQLKSIRIPEKYWTTLYNKLTNLKFDIGDLVQMVHINYGDQQREPHEPIWGLLTHVKMSPNDPTNIYLIDHTWTFRIRNIRTQLEQNPSLCHRLALMLDLGESYTIGEIEKNVWRLCNTYNIDNANSLEEGLPIWYVMDEIGSSISHSEEPNTRCIPFIHVNNDIHQVYSLLYALKEIDEGRILTRDFGQGFEGVRKDAILLPWQPKHFDGIIPETVGDDYYISGHVHESLPNVLNEVSDFLVNKKPLKVYTEYELIARFLTSDNFQIVTNESDADILWYTTHFRDYEHQQKFVNQFPYEYVLTVKDLLALTARKSTEIDPETGVPHWIPITYNLVTEVGNFCAYYQKMAMQRSPEENYWIVKPFNLARSLDMHITNDLVCLMRLPLTGPKIAQEYVTKPVLFQRDDIQGGGDNNGGGVKFDVRFVILLKSVQPLVAYVCKEFYLRFANIPFSLDEFHLYEKHFTVMNYEKNVDLKQMRAEEFKKQWKVQYPSFDWTDVNDSILGALKNLLECAVSEPPPRGIAHNPLSRAMYAADIILEWGGNKEKIIPKILEINWTPDCKRACDFDADFYNDIFDLLFLDKESDKFFKL